MLTKLIISLIFQRLSLLISKKAMKRIAMKFYGHPENDLKIIAFTGTKGKQPLLIFAYNILRNKATDLRCFNHEHNFGRQNFL